MKKNKEAMGVPKRQVKTVIWQTVKKQKWLSLGIVLAVVGAYPASDPGPDRGYHHRRK